MCTEFGNTLYTQCILCISNFEFPWESQFPWFILFLLDGKEKSIKAAMLVATRFTLFQTFQNLDILFLKGNSQ